LIVSAETTLDPRLRGDDNRNRLQSQLNGQIAPVSILGLDQRDLPIPVPFLDPLFPKYRFTDVCMLFELDKARNTILARESFGSSHTMFDNPAGKIIGDAAVQRAVLT
jgi:hypothetical protein